MKHLTRSTATKAIGFCKTDPSEWFPPLVRHIAVGAVISFSAVSANAHVKWFFDYDVTKPPAPIGEVLDGTFIKLFLVSVVACYIFFLVDRYGAV